jgi:hypothetical protein
MAFYGAGFYAGKFYYGYATKTVVFDYTPGTSVLVSLSANDTANSDRVEYYISTDAGDTYTQITDTLSFVPDTDDTTQSFVLKVMFITQSAASSVSIDDITLTISEAVTLYSLAVKVLEDFDNETGILDGKYIIDSALGEVAIPNAYLSVQSYQSALKLIAEAGAARAYSTRDGYFVMKQIGEDPEYQISRDIDSYFSMQNATNPTDLYNRVSIQVNPLIKSDAREEIATLSETIDANTVETYTISYTNDPSEDVIYSSSTLPDDVSITDFTEYTWGAVVEVTNANDTEQDITILLEGYTYTVEGAFEVQLDDSTSIRKHGVSELVIDNPLIQTQEQAEAINTLLLSSFKSQQRLVETDIQINPALEIGDGASINSKGYSIYSQDISYDDSGIIQTIKGVKV